MRILAVAGQFPAISEVFMVDLVTGLHEMGHEVWIEADQPTAEAQAYYKEILEKCRPYTQYRDRFPDTVATRLADGVARTLRWGWRSPTTLLGCMNPLKYGWGALTGRILCQTIPRGKRLGRFDVIHGHFGHNGVRALGARRTGAAAGPIVTSFHGSDLNARMNQDGRRFYADLFRRGDLFTTGSLFMRRRLAELGAPVEKIRKVTVPLPLKGLPFRERKMPKDGVVRIISVGRLVEVKGVEYGIRAVSVLRSRGRRVIYNIVGDGPLRKELENLAHDLGAGDAVKFAGARPHEEVLQAFDESDIFLHSGVIARNGEVEALGGSIIEGGACGLPVIASNVGGIPEAMVNGESGLLVPDRNVEALVEAMEWLLQRPEKWAEMGAIGRKFTIDAYDSSKSLIDLLSVYQEAMHL